jgi:hypothetical protein
MFPVKVRDEPDDKGKSEYSDAIFCGTALQTWLLNHVGAHDVNVNNSPTPDTDFRMQDVQYREDMALRSTNPITNKRIAAVHVMSSDEIEQYIHDSGPNNNLPKHTYTSKELEAANKEVAELEEKLYALELVREDFQRQEQQMDAAKKQSMKNKKKLTDSVSKIEEEDRHMYMKMQEIKDNLKKNAKELEAVREAIGRAKEKRRPIQFQFSSKEFQSQLSLETVEKFIQHIDRLQRRKRETANTETKELMIQLTKDAVKAFGYKPDLERRPIVPGNIYIFKSPVYVLVRFLIILEKDDGKYFGQTFHLEFEENGVIFNVPKVVFGSDFGSVNFERLGLEVQVSYDLFYYAGNTPENIKVTEVRNEMDILKLARLVNTTRINRAATVNSSSSRSLLF